jgi:hypothetical protein
LTAAAAAHSFINLLIMLSAKNSHTKITYWTGVLAASLALGAAIQIVLAWTQPSSTPPSNNVPAPINVSAVEQYKTGALGIGGVFIADNSTYLATSTGKVGIGTTTPKEKLVLEGGNFLVSSGNPALEGSIDNSDPSAILTYSRGVFVSGQYAYVANYGGVNCSSGGIDILDVSNPSSPESISTISGTANCYIDVFVSGRHLYAISDGGLEIYDISAPANPAYKGKNYNYTPTPIDGGIYVSGQYAYVAVRDFGFNPSRIVVFDVSNPADPKMTDYISYDNPNITGPKGIYVQGGYAYVANSDTNALEIINVSDPYNIYQAGLIDDASCDAANGNDCKLAGASSVYVSGPYAYVTGSSDQGVEILDVSDPANPLHAGSISGTPDLQNPRNIYVSGRYAYVTSWRRVAVIDVSDPANPSLIGLIADNDGTNFFNSSYDIAVVGKYAYVTDDSFGLVALDISGIDAPAASIGSLAVGSAQVAKNVNINNGLYVQGGINIGSAGIFSRGPIQATTTKSLTVISATTTSPSFFACDNNLRGGIIFSVNTGMPCYCNGSSWLRFKDGVACN